MKNYAKTVLKLCKNGTKMMQKRYKNDAKTNVL